MAISTSLGEIRELTIPSGTIRYRERGSGHVLLFLHGAIVNGDVWRKVVPLLADDYRCITPDWPLGSHEIPMSHDADLTPSGMARIIIDFVDALGEDEITVVSNDTATALTQLALVREPRRITRAILTQGDAFSYFFPPMFKPLTAMGYVPGSLRFAGLLLRPTFAKRLGYMPVTKSLKDPAIFNSYIDPPRKNAAVRRDLHKFLRAIRSRYTLEAAPKLSSFKGPVLVVWGHGDMVFPLSLGERLVEAFDHAELATIPDTRTFIPEDQPEALVETMRKFLVKTDPTSAAAKVGEADRAAI